MVYEKLFAQETIDAAATPYAIDDDMRELRARNVLPDRWATFIHMGA